MRLEIFFQSELAKHILVVCLATATALSGRSIQRGLAFEPRRPPTSVAAEARTPEKVLAHWSFNEADGQQVRAASGVSSLHADYPVPRQVGVRGNALLLKGEHQLQVGGIATEDTLPEIAFSAWVRPHELSGYREIYRQECPERILFSFQHDGTILALGLNIGGYVECDAAVRPSQVLDGAWHHVAGSFDGRWMEVFLDGKRIGRLERPGTIVTNSVVPAFIGSSGGRGEFFQGGLDELRAHAKGLTEQTVAALYHRGIETVTKRLARHQKQLDTLYPKGLSFAHTLACLRKKAIAGGIQDSRDLLALGLTRLRADFPQACAAYTQATGKSPLEYLAAKELDSFAEHLDRHVARMREYQPLTPTQKRRLSDVERRHWKEVQHIVTRYEKLRNAESPGTSSPEFIKVLLAAAEKAPQRPAVREAVAPYRPPQTPVTQDLTAAEARETLERDWLHQAGGATNPERIVQEIHWTRQLARRLETQYPQVVDFSADRSKLKDLELRARELTGRSHSIYFAVREIKRSIMFRNPAVDFDEVLFVDLPFPQGSEWQHETRHRLGYMAVPGGRLLTLKGLAPDGHLRQLMPQPPLHGSFWRPDLSYDATKVLFCFKPHNEKSFHLYEINLDGTGCRQLTDGPYDDLDPIYLPDGKHIMFSTTRSHTYVRCMPPTNAFVLARCDRNGDDMYLVSRNNEPDYLPSVLADGRVVYTRWEYTDKPLWRAQGLWTVNPDGTQVNTLWGNQSVWPDLLKDARGIPGSRRIMFTGSAHHNWFAGSVGIIDPQGGFNFPAGLTKVTADVAWPESGNGPVDPVECSAYHNSGRYAGYYSPFPLSETDFLVSANRDGKFVLYLMDVWGNRELIYEGAHQILHALPVRPRSRPPVIPDRVNWPSKEERKSPEPGVIFSGDVYQGAPPQLRGKAHYLRILNIEPKTYTYWHKRPYLSTGPVVSAVQSEGVKRVLGTVPVEEDGSVNFYAPSGMALHFQLLDHRYRALQTMRSFTGVMPGEERGCLGCHESHSRAPEYGNAAAALNRPPSKIQTPPWAEESVSYGRFVRPVLDRYCGECHQGHGEAVDTFDITPRTASLFFDETYLLLTGRPTWGTEYQKPDPAPPGFGLANMLMVEGYGKVDPEAYRTPEPMTRLSYNSPLIELASSGEHYGVQVDPLSLRKLIAWVDTMCPYRGSEQVRAIEDPEFPGIDWLPIRPQIENAPTIVRPGPIDSP